MSKKISRREFLTGAAVTGIGVLGASALPMSVFGAGTPAAEAMGPKSRVVIVSSDRLIVAPEKNANPIANTGMVSVGESNPGIDQVMLRTMLDQSIAALTGKKKVIDAWRSLFKPEDVVGLKVNCIAGKGLSTHPELVAAIIAGLLSVGIPKDHIIVWDRTARELIRCGYRPNETEKEVIVRGSENFWDQKETSLGLFNGRLTRIISEKITALINVPILKDHGASGVTAAFKNHYGSIDNPGAHHRDGCAALPDLNSVPAIKDKTRLIVLDAINATCNGGPGQNPEFMWNAQTLAVATDPVALDYEAMQMIDERRVKIKLKTLKESGREPKWLAVAATKGLGTNDPKRIEVIRKVVLP